MFRSTYLLLTLFSLLLLFRSSEGILFDQVTPRVEEQGHPDLSTEQEDAEYLAAKAKEASDLAMEAWRLARSMLSMKEKMFEEDKRVVAQLGRVNRTCFNTHKEAIEAVEKARERSIPPYINRAARDKLVREREGQDEESERKRAKEMENREDAEHGESVSAYALNLDKYAFTGPSVTRKL